MAGVEGGVGAAFAEEFFVGALFRDVALRHVEDEVCSANPKDWLAKLSIRLA